MVKEDEISGIRPGSQQSKAQAPNHDLVTFPNANEYQNAYEVMVGETLHVVNCMQIFQTWRRAPTLESPRNSQLTIYLVRRPHDVIDCNCGGHSEIHRQEL
jgi:hypothetical protein